MMMIAVNLFVMKGYFLRYLDLRLIINENSVEKESER
jgi:hypothetical protein